MATLCGAPSWLSNLSWKALPAGTLTSVVTNLMSLATIAGAFGSTEAAGPAGWSALVFPQAAATSATAASAMVATSRFIVRVPQAAGAGLRSWPTFDRPSATSRRTTLTGLPSARRKSTASRKIRLTSMALARYAVS